MKARVKWAENMTFIGESDSGHGVVMDAAPEIGGRNLGARPMELLLMGTGGCTSIDVVLFLKKNNQCIEDCVVELEAERAATDPKVFKKVHLHYVIKGKNIEEKFVKTAIQLSASKYCSATITLAQTATVTHDYEIINTAEAE